MQYEPAPEQSPMLSPTLKQIQVISYTDTPILISHGANFRQVFFSRMCCETNSRGRATQVPGFPPAQGRPCALRFCFSRFLCLTACMCLRPHQSSASPVARAWRYSWDRPAMATKSVLSHAAQMTRDNGAARPRRRRIGQRWPQGVFSPRRQSGPSRPSSLTR